MLILITLLKLVLLDQRKCNGDHDKGQKTYIQANYIHDGSLFSYPRDRSSVLKS